MAKRIKDSTMTLEIKKEYLKKHLDDVENLIERWLPELSAPALLAPQKGLWGWQSAYRPSIELDPDSNHMIRKHLPSRTLWSHHANWEREMDHIWHSINQIRRQAVNLINEPLSDEKWEYHEDYLNTAIWKGFEKACGKEMKLLYSLTDNGLGMKYGAYIIEMSAVDADMRSVVECRHSGLIDAIAELKATKELVNEFFEAERLEERMKTLVGNLLKSKDILYLCKFCKHLWR